MAERKRILDNLEISIREDFKPIINLIKEMEEYVESNLIELPNDELDYTDVESLEDSIRELIDKYNSFIDELLPLAGTVKMQENEGAKSLESLEKFKSTLEKLLWNINELKEIFKGNKANSDTAKAIVLDFVKNINELISNVRAFLSQEIYASIDNILKDVEKIERYYQ